MDDYLAKPVREEKLAEILRRWLEAGGKVETTGEAIQSDHNQEALLDDETISQLTAESELFCELIDLFLPDSAAKIETINRALHQGDAVLAARLAHTLKGTSANMGASQLSHRVAQMETAIHAQQLPKARELCIEVQSAFEKVRHALETERIRCTSVRANS
jgi:HPt (histidine-containing phosphotransfer) domain-containing protein